MTNIAALRQLDISMLPVTHQEVIPESYLDMMGHVNVMWYTHLFSCAGGGMLKMHGMSREYFESKQSGSFALETHIRYLTEIRVGARVSVRTRMLGRSEKRSHFMHFIYNDDQQVISATGEFINTHIDMRIRKPSPFPPDIAAAIDSLIEQHRQIPWEAPVCGTMHP